MEPESEPNPAFDSSDKAPQRWVRLVYNGVSYPDYLVSEFGLIKGPRAHTLSQTLDRSGYLTFSVSGTTNGFKVHKAVLESFIGPPPEGRTTVNHKDHIKLNNALSNLEWSSHSEQMFHHFENGTTSGYKHRTTGIEQLVDGTWTMTPFESTEDLAKCLDRSVDVAQRALKQGVKYRRVGCDDREGEEWRTMRYKHHVVDEFECSNMGRIRNKATRIEKPGTPHTAGSGHVYMQLKAIENGGVLLFHRIIAYTWLPPPPAGIKPQVNHIDTTLYGERQLMDNRASNLQWMQPGSKVGKNSKSRLIEIRLTGTEEWVRYPSIGAAERALKAMGLPASSLGEFDNPKKSRRPYAEYAIRFVNK